MKWIFLFACVLSSTLGDTLSAKGMAADEEIEGPILRGLAHVPRYIVTHRMVLGGIAGNAVSFFSFLALLSVASLSFAVPATAIGYILKTAVAEFYLQEDVGWRRWTGVVLVAVGIYLLTI